jgi:hypothetical protein
MYHVELERQFDSKDLVDDKIVLGPGESTNYRYKENIIYRADFRGQLHLITNSFTERGNPVHEYVIIDNNKTNFIHVLQDSKSQSGLSMSKIFVKDGKQSLHIDGKASSFIQLSCFINKDIGTNTSIIRLWVFSASDFYRPGIIINDIKTNSFSSLYPANLVGGRWIQVSIPVKGFLSRTDFNPNNLSPGTKISLPISTVDFFSIILWAFPLVSAYWGKFDVYFDSLELVE